MDRQRTERSSVPHPLRACGRWCCVAAPPSRSPQPPLAGALIRASNIMSEIMRSGRAAQRPTTASAARPLSALTHRIIYIMCKCPAATDAAVGCAAHVGPGYLAPLARASLQARLIPTHPCVSAWRAAAAIASCASARHCHPSMTVTPEKNSSCTCKKLAPCSARQGQAAARCCATLTALRAALVGWHVQKAFLGGDPPQEHIP